MNIVIFSDTYLPKIDGVGVSVDNFTRILAERGHNFVICCPAYGDGDFYEAGERIKIVRFKNASLPSYPDVRVVLPSHKRIREAMTAFEPDLVHIQSPGLLGQYGVFAARAYQVPLIGTYHTLVSEQETYLSLYRLLKVDALLNRFRSHKKVKKRLDKVVRKKEKTLKKRIIMKLANRMYESGSLVISPSQRIKKELESSGIKKPVTVISNGTDLNLFQPIQRTAPGSAPRLLHAGRISYEKNCDVVLKAFALILKEIPDASLEIVGDGPALPSLKIEAKRMDLDDRVKFTGFVPHDTLPAVFARNDLFLTASTMETQGLVVLESLATGMPSVGVDAFALPELIEDGKNGFIVPPYDHIAMAQHALKVLKDSALYNSFSKKAVETATEHSLEKCADKMEQTYSQVISKKEIPQPGEELPEIEDFED